MLVTKSLNVRFDPIEVLDVVNVKLDDSHDADRVLFNPPGQEMA